MATKLNYNQLLNNKATVPLRIDMKNFSSEVFQGQLIHTFLVLRKLVQELQA